MKTFLKEFKEFIARGNVVSMAVGIIIGSAFTAIVNSLVSDIITPLIGVILGGMDFSGWTLVIGDATVTIGSFINSVISFLLTALVLFSLMKAMNAILPKKEEAPKEPEIPADVALLTEIRDLLKAQQGAAQPAIEQAPDPKEIPQKQK